MSEKRSSRQFYGPAGRTWDDFKRICKREGSSASEKLTSYVEQYVIIHAPGNPQTLIPSFTDNGSITVENLEGRLRQQCMERANFKGFIHRRDVLERAKEIGLSIKQAMAMTDRTLEWLRKTMMVEVRI